MRYNDEDNVSGLFQEDRIMFELFRPKEYVSSIYDIDYNELWDKGIRGLLFDIDNTLATYDAPAPTQLAEELVHELREMGFSIWIISNGKKERVLSFAKRLSVPAIWKAHKPFPTGIGKIRKHMKLRPEQIAIIGDQLFTDVCAGNMGRIYSILVKPISEERDEWVTKIKRNTEKRFILKMNLNLKSKIRNYRERRALMHVDGSTQVLAVIGDPIAHTLSPMIHQLFIDSRGDNYAYVPYQVKPEHVKTAIEGAWNLGIRGINVTIPHKQAVLESVCETDVSAQLVGAVNTLKWTPQGYKGYNTDVDGLTKLLKINQISVKERKILVLGAGGAARSALAVCFLMGASEVVIYNRTRERAEDLIREFEENVKLVGKELTMKLRTVSEPDLSKEAFPIVLQTTSAGMYPNTGILPVYNEEFYHQIKYAVDMVFNPLESAFCQKVKANGGYAVSGLSMLFYQGSRSYEIWTGKNFKEKNLRRMHARFLMVSKKRLENE